MDDALFAFVHIPKFLLPLRVSRRTAQYTSSNNKQTKACLLLYEIRA